MPPVNHFSLVRHQGRSDGVPPILYRLWLPVSVLVLVTMSATPARADAFLDLIKQEVHSIEVDPASQKSITGSPAPSPSHKVEQTTRKAAPPNKQAHDMPAGMSPEEFEAFLQKHYIGSFSFYRKLTELKKKEVYQAYNKRPEIRFVRERIKQTYLN